MVYGENYLLEACRATVPRRKLSRRIKLELLVDLPRRQEL